MKKILVFCLGLLVLVSTTEAATISVDPVPAKSNALPFDMSWNMSPKQYELLTGKKLNVIQKFAFKIAAKKLKNAPAAEGKSQLTAALLAFFLGALGIHRFYLGYTWQGVVQLLTLGGLGVWALIDFVRILTGDLKPKDGEYAKTL